MVVLIFNRSLVLCSRFHRNLSSITAFKMDDSGPITEVHPVDHTVDDDDSSPLQTEDAVVQPEGQAALTHVAQDFIPVESLTGDQTPVLLVTRDEAEDCISPQDQSEIQPESQATVQEVDQAEIPAAGADEIPGHDHRQSEAQILAPVVEPEVPAPIDANAQTTAMISTGSMADLSSEVRVNIWKFLSRKDRKTLRLVCKDFKQDIEQSVGLHGILLIAEDSLSFFRSRTYSLNLRFIQTVILKGLTLKNLNRFQKNFQAQTMLKAPQYLRKLIIELDYDQAPADLTTEILSICNHLHHLSITGSAHFRQSLVGPFNTLAQSVLRNLKTNEALKELIFRIPQIFIPKQASGFDSRIIGAVPLGVMEYSWTQNPLRLQKLDLCMLTLSMQQLQEWKRFLDAQDELVELKCNFGLVHWQFYRTVLEKSDHTLRHLDLVFINWSLLTSISESEWFDWNILAPMSNSLESLRLSMVCSHVQYQALAMSNAGRGGRAFETLNFPNLTLNALKKLELSGIALRQTYLEKIFQGFPRLTEITLSLWNKTILLPMILNNAALPSDFGAQNTHLFNALLEALQQKRLEKIQLTDESLMGCTKLVDNVVFAQARMIPKTRFSGLARPGMIDMQIHMF